jgi:hypothetical protein
MPYVRISLRRGKSQHYIEALLDSLQQSLESSFDVPPGDCFQIVHQLDAHELRFNRHYGAGPRSDDFVHIAITAGRPRDRAQHSRFYRCLVDALAISPGIRPEDVMVVINTTEPEGWSFGNGEIARFPTLFTPEP